MESAEFSGVTNLRRVNDAVATAEYGDDSKLIVQFSTQPHMDGAASREQGRAIYKDRDYIKIMFPGNKNTEINRPVDMKGRRGNPPDPDRWPRQWAAYKNRQEQKHEGTPLAEWGPISRSHALTYQALNIHTVEQLANVPDSSIDQLGHGGRKLRDQAESWLKATKDSSAVLKMQSQISKQSDEIEMLKAQIADLGSSPKKRPGRPAKSA